MNVRKTHSQETGGQTGCWFLGFKRSKPPPPSKQIKANKKRTAGKIREKGIPRGGRLLKTSLLSFVRSDRAGTGEFRLKYES